MNRIMKQITYFVFGNELSGVFLLFTVSKDCHWCGKKNTEVGYFV